MDGGFLLGRFVIDDEVGCIVDRLDELSTIHFSDKIDFYSLNEFLNRQERKIDRYKGYVNDPFKSVNDQFQQWLGCTFEEFLEKRQVRFYELETNMSVSRSAQPVYCMSSFSPVAMQYGSQMGNIILKGQFL